MIERLRRVLAAPLVVLATGCSDGFMEAGGAIGRDDEGLFCSVPTDEIASVLAPDAIISLVDPPFVPPEHTDAAYVRQSDRVVGFLLEGEPVAVPLNILRTHEVVNLNRASERVAVTYCPLTGSSLVFDRSGLGGVELGVSGLLHKNNLVMYDRNEERSFFTQMRRGTATCGPAARSGASLEIVPSIELRWDAWKRLYPNTVVVSEETGSVGDYGVNPHADYERADNEFILVPMEVDDRRLPKERVLGIPVGGDGGPAFPFLALASSDRSAIPALNGSVVVFWQASAEAAAAYSTELDARRLEFAATDRGYVDLETGSQWRLDGLAVSGPLSGRRLEPIIDAYVAFWFAWAAFHPETVVWDGSGE